MSQIHFLDKQYCPACKQTSASGFRDHGCHQHSFLDQLYSISWYRGVTRPLINQFKFDKRVRGIASTIELIIKRTVGEEGFSSWQDVTVTAVPLHKKQLKYRGFNQSELIARSLASFLQVPTRFDLLERHKARPQQSHLGREERRVNVKGVFRAVKQSSLIGVIPSRILLVDDVYTTGSTLNECAKVLKKEVGVEKVFGFTLARG